MEALSRRLQGMRERAADGSDAAPSPTPSPSTVANSLARMTPVCGSEDAPPPEAWPALPLPAPPPPTPPDSLPTTHDGSDGKKFNQVDLEKSCNQLAALDTAESPPEAEASLMDAGTTQSDESPFYTFYQAEDGQMLILHPLCMRILLSHYTSYDQMPTCLEAPVLEMEEQIQTAETRKRYKFLSHLPLTVRFHLCELDLSAVLPKESLVPFAEELDKRSKNRKRHAKKMRDTAAKEAKEAKEAEAARWGPSAAELKTMPSLGAREFVPEDHENIEIFTMDDPSLPPEGGTSSRDPPALQQPTISFAHVTNLGYASGFNAPCMGQTAAGPTIISGPTPTVPGPTPTWGTKGSWGRVTEAQPTHELAEDTSSSQGGRKNKKGKQQILFSTNHRGRS